MGLKNSSGGVEPERSSPNIGDKNNKNIIIFVSVFIINLLNLKIFIPSF
jgi:hypothetical protein